MATETKRDRFDKRLVAMRKDRELMLPEWRELAQNFVPRHMPWLFDQGEQNTRKRRNTTIINTHPRTAARTLQRGMTAGVASPARPWFRLRAPDPDLNEFAPVKTWLDQVKRELENMFARSNFYNTLGTCYGDEGVFGTLGMGMFEDEITDMRCIAYPIGSYMIATNARGVVDTFYREYRPTVRQMVDQFGRQPDGKVNLTNLSANVRTNYERGNLEERSLVIHVLEPNDERTPGRADSANMLMRSCYYEDQQTDKGILLRESGFEEMPVQVARWEVLGEDPWGTGPGLDALGDAKALQQREKQKAKRIDKHNDPAMVGHPDLKNKRVSLLPGDVTYVGFTPTGGAPLLQPAHQVDHDTSDLIEDVGVIQARISRCFDEDLFLMISMSDRRQVTAEEIAKRFEEKVVMIGPVLERQNDELLNPAIDRSFGIALRRGKVPPPPKELQGSVLKVEYVSLLAQAQRLVGASSIDRFVGFIGGLAKAQVEAGEAPSVLDKVDFDQAADEYSEALGVPPRVVRSDDQVLELREERASREQAQQLAAAGQPVAQAAKAAKDLSETQVNGRSVLDRIADASGAAA